MIWRNANHGVDVLPVLSSSEKSGKNNRISDNFSFISIMSLCDCRWYSFYVMTIFSMATCNLSNSWINVVFETHNYLSCGALNYVFYIWIGHLFCFLLYIIVLCTSKWNRTSARFINKCWRCGSFCLLFDKFVLTIY